MKVCACGHSRAAHRDGRACDECACQKYEPFDPHNVEPIITTKPLRLPDRQIGLPLSVAVQEVFGLGDRAVARRTDRDTSHDAAASITPQKLTEARAFVLELFRSYGPMTDVTLRAVYEAARKQNPSSPQMSDSGLRTRRSELCEPLMQPPAIRDTGRTVRLASGRQATVWEAV